MTRSVALFVPSSGACHVRYVVNRRSSSQRSRVNSRGINRGRERIGIVTDEHLGTNRVGELSEPRRQGRGITPAARQP